MDQFEVAYQEAKLRDPGASYARVSSNMIFRSLIEKGAQHATLGTNLERKDEWESQGLQTFNRLLKFHKASPKDRVLEFGCGSLRVAYHFINFLNPHNFLGLDVISGFYEIGKLQLGPKMLDAKKPNFAVIGSNSIESAIEFAADFVYLSGVAIHVHDDDASDFFANLRMITHKRGTKIVMSAHIATTSFQHVGTSWARPLNFYTDQLRGLRLLKFYPSATRASAYGDYQVGYLEFVRD